MTRRIRKLDMWRGYACVLATAMLLAGCSSDLTGPDTGTGTTGTPRIDGVEHDLLLGSGKPVLRRCDVRVDDVHKVCVPEFRVTR
ncbi:MAG: hypothetical protein ACRENP_13365 [Longimicrobiales bacterium]